MSVQKDFKNVAQITLPARNFMPAVAEAASEQFPLSDIVDHIGIDDVQCVPIEVLESGRMQSLNSVFEIIKARAYSQLGHCDENRASLSADESLRKDKAQIDDLKVLATNEQTYLCTNISVIRDALAPMSSVLQNDLEDVARAVQKALVSDALRNKRPIIFVYSLIEDADKHVMYMADRFVWKRDHAKTQDIDLVLAAQ